MAAVICIESFSPDLRENMQWPAYARFAAVHKGIGLPINPQWPFMPMWQVIPPQSATIEAAPSYSTAFSPTSSKDVEEFEFSVETMCTTSKVIGLEINASHGAAGLVTLQWGSSSDMGISKNRLRRFYPDGPVKMHFAVERSGQEPYFKISLNPSAARTTVNGITVYCL
jgi:hypothetical protein